MFSTITNVSKDLPAELSYNITLGLKKKHKPLSGILGKPWRNALLEESLILLLDKKQSVKIQKNMKILITFLSILMLYAC